MNGRDLDLCEGPLMTRNGMRPPTPRSSSMTLGGAPSDRKSNTSELQSQSNLVCRLLLEKKKNLYVWCGGEKNDRLFIDYYRVRFLSAFNCIARPALCRVEFNDPLQPLVVSCSLQLLSR